ncbi:MAG: methenyltetrahydromethanopterin cyclohydrolase [Euryarchaeota archaeon]|nr:methenyltetrahydromethanopterin cyclohydrolase [Euryarchaeota archaeon]
MVGLNDLALQVYRTGVQQARQLGVREHTLPSGAHLLDLGVGEPGSQGAGLIAARITLGDQAQVALHRDEANRTHVAVESSRPAVACLGCQYAVWYLPSPGGGAMASGPGRILARKPRKLMEHLGLAETPGPAVLFLESETLPDDTTVAEISAKTGAPPTSIYLAVAPSNSVAGNLQICARALENAMLKLWTLGYDVNRVARSTGRAPLVPLRATPREAMGAANDSLRWGGEAHLDIRDPDIEGLRRTVEQVPTRATRDRDRGFLEVLDQARGDFGKVDPHLFCPARITVRETTTGTTIEAGGVHEEKLRRALRP